MSEWFLVFLCIFKDWTWENISANTLPFFGRGWGFFSSTDPKWHHNILFWVDQSIMEGDTSSNPKWHPLLKHLFNCPRIPSGNSILFGVCKNPQKDGNVGNHAILEPLFGIFFVGYCTWYTVKSSFMKTPAANLNRRKLQVEVEAWTVEVWESKVGSSLDSKV